MNRFLTTPRILATLAALVGVLLAVPAAGGEGWSGLVIVCALMLVVGFFGLVFAAVNRLDRI